MKALILALTISVIAGIGASAHAQEPTGDPVHGIITGVTTDAAGSLVSFSLVNAQGESFEFQVRADASPTEYGLENQAGDRWVSSQAQEPVEAATRLQQHQARLAPVTVTVTADGSTALAVVDRESGRLEMNLAFLFAIYTITWAGFFAYAFVVSRRQRDIRRELADLRHSLETQGNRA